jgi:hypothetical protein
MKSKSTLTKFFEPKNKKFVLLIGEEGAILTLYAGKTLKTRIFASLTNAEDIVNIKATLKKNPKISISILVDVIDQTYTMQSLPAVSSLTINNLVKKKLSRSFSENDLTGAIFIDKNKDGRADWNYLFISTPFSGPLLDWVNILITEQNKINGIFLLPIEGQNIIKQLDNIFSELVTKKPKALNSDINNWKILFLHNKISGFRQITFKNDKIAFTRQISINNDETPDFIAGTLDQEVKNSYEYLKRLSTNEQDKISICIMVSKEIKLSLKKIKLVIADATIVTPYEAANTLGFENAVSEEDKFCDILISGIFCTSKALLSFIPAKIKNLFLLEKLRKFLKLISYLIVPACICYIAMLQYNIYNINQELLTLEYNKNKISKDYDQKKQESKKLGDVEKISEVISLYSALSSDISYAPLDTLSIIVEVINKEKIYAKSINWQASSSSSSSSQSSSSRPTTNNNANKSSSISISLDLDFINSSNEYEKLFDNFDRFTKKLTKGLSDYNVQYSKIVDNINFNEVNKIIPVKVTITGPNKKKE